MSKARKRAGRRGRNLELLVKRIKEHQVPDAIIRSPDFVTDKDTGQRREVDVGIHVHHAGCSTFIAIECRDRISIQAVDWVEQLISKKQSIGADALVAVTSSQFSRPARLKALKHGVILARMSLKLPEELAKLASSFFVTLRYLAPRILEVDMQIPSHLRGEADAFRYRHPKVDHDLTVLELAQALSTPDLIRTIPRYVRDWTKTDCVEIKLPDLQATIICDEKELPITGLTIRYELNYGELELPLHAVQELAALEGPSPHNARAYEFGKSGEARSEIIVDDLSGNLRLDILGKTLLKEGKVLIGAKVRASKPVRFTTMLVDV